MVFATVVSFFIFYEVGLAGYTCFVNLGSWIYVGLLRLDWIFWFDSVTVLMLILVVFVSLLVHVYSIDYMSEDPHLARFVGYLSLFTFFMIVLVTSGTFVQLFLGWEGVGLSSYLLINFWYTRIQASKSAMKAIIINRFGDFGIYFALLIIFFYFKSFSFAVVFSLVDFFSFSVQLKFFSFSFSPVDLIAFFLFIGAVGKSAQLGLHTWLPDAMEGPTPVSALIHAATMVTAGIFVLIRCSPILEYSDSVLFLIALVGSLTALFAGTVGLVQYDIKKVIAYSTCSQLGYMFFACGMSNYSVALFHLFNHGFFKALLFLGAGSVIHALADEQDMRRMGGMVKLLPVTYISMLIGSLSLMGFPFLTGFYSKEVVLGVAFAKFSTSSFFVYWLGVLAASVTSFYSVRLIYLVFFTDTNSYTRVVNASHESSSFIFYALCVLGFLSVFIGFIFKDLFVGLGVDFFGGSVFQSPNNCNLLYAEFLDYYYKVIPVVFSFIGACLSLLAYFFWYNVSLFTSTGGLFLGAVYVFLVKKWFFDLLYSNLFVFKSLDFFYRLTFKEIYRGLVEFFGPLSLVRCINLFSKLFSSFQTGHIYVYIFVMLLGITFFLKLTLFFSVINSLYYFINFKLVVCLLCTVLFLGVAGDTKVLR
jgi:NADH-ubiquinone oxidoreductase chain 5